MLGVPRGEVRGQLVWFSPALPAMGEEHHGQSTGREGLVPMRLWLLRAYCRAHGGLAAVKESLRLKLYDEEARWDAQYSRTTDGVLLTELRPCPPFPAPTPSETLWRELCGRFDQSIRTSEFVARLARALWEAQEAVGMVWTGTRFTLTSMVHHYWIAIARSHLDQCKRQHDTPRPSIPVEQVGAEVALEAPCALGHVDVVLD